MTDSTLQLAWRRPAHDWSEATPIGDGRLGAMVFGGASARFQVNDATAWSGTPDGPADELERLRSGGAGPERLAEVRAALDVGDLDLAEHLLMSFEGRYSQEFLPFIDLVVDVPGAQPQPEEPWRTLDLDRAFVQESFTVDGAGVSRRSWVRDHVLFIEITAERPLPEITLHSSTPLRELARNVSNGVMTLDVAVPVDGAPLHEPSVDPALTYAGSAGTYDGFACAVLAARSDGIVDTDGTTFRVRDAGRLLIALSTSTRAESWWADAADEWRTISPETIRNRARDRVVGILADESRDLFAEHDAARRLAATARFAIGGRREGRWDVETDILGGDDGLRATVARRIRSIPSRIGVTRRRTGREPAGHLERRASPRVVVELHDQYQHADELLGGRAARTHRQRRAAHLARRAHGGDGKGRRARAVRLPRLGCAPQQRPLGVEPAGRHGARRSQLGDLDDGWRLALPLVVGSGRVCGRRRAAAHAYLATHPGCREFCLDWIVVDEDGVARFSPSTSPENMYADCDGQPRALGLTATMDVELVQSLFSRALLAIDRVDPECALRSELEAALTTLPQPSVGTDGRLQEWSEDVGDHEPGHRHLSALVGLYPLDLFSNERTPEFAEAACRFLDARGPGAMGWSWAWKIALRARLRDGETAHDLLREALTPLNGDVHRHSPVDGSEWGGLLPNLFSAHPPFQIDGNLGFPAAIAELLLQSHHGSIDLLPALPTAWPNGRVDGLRARGGLSIDLAWSHGRLRRATITDTTGVTRGILVRHGDSSFDIDLPAGGSIVVTDPPQHQPGTDDGVPTITVRNS